MLKKKKKKVQRVSSAVNVQETKQRLCEILLLTFNLTAERSLETQDRTCCVLVVGYLQVK